MGGGLHWDSNDLEVKVEKNDKEIALFVFLRGTFPTEVGSLVYERGLLVTKQLRDQNLLSFGMKVPLEGPTTEVRIINITPAGTVTPIGIQVEFPEYEAFLADARIPKKDALSIIPGFGFSTIGLRETLVSDFGEVSAEVNLQLGYHLKPQLDLLVRSYFNFLQLSTNQTGIQASFFGLTGGVEYYTKWLKEPLLLSWRGGIGYATSFVTSNQFGYQNLIGPKLGPVLKYQLPGEQGQLSVFFEYSPFISGDFPAFSSQELSGGLSFSRKWKKHPVWGTLRGSSTHLNFQNVLFIDTTSVVLSFGYEFGAIPRQIIQ